MSASTGHGAEIVQAGNLKSALFILRLAQRSQRAGARVRASDTPTGTGVMPMGVLKASASWPRWAICAGTVLALATGNNARAFRLAGAATLGLGQPATSSCANRRRRRSRPTR